MIRMRVCCLRRGCACLQDYWNVDKTPVTEDYAAGMVEDVGLTHAQLLDITIAYNATIKELYNRTLAAGKIGWQMCYGGSVYETSKPKVTKANCATSLRLHCAADSPTQHRAYLARGWIASSCFVVVSPVLGCLVLSCLVFFSSLSFLFAEKVSSRELMS